MLQQLSKRLVSTVSLGLDWQAQNLRLVLLQPPKNPPDTQGPPLCLGQWSVPIPPLESFDPLAEKECSAWFRCLAQINDLMGQQHLLVTLGLPKSYFTWLHAPQMQFTQAHKPNLWYPTNVNSQIKQQLAYQRWAAAKLNLDASSVLVEHLQLAPVLTMLLVLNTHYARPVENLLAHLQAVINTTIEASLEPLVLSRVRCPKEVDADHSMAWWLAQKCWNQA
ncbi:MAG TPA: hypothetical protein DE045_11195 [Oceanospirillaceae bacterium]|nr:hypothetical protein [Oceanospirillaceae bacterium]